MMPPSSTTAVTYFIPISSNFLFTNSMSEHCTQDRWYANVIYLLFSLWLFQLFFKNIENSCKKWQVFLHLGYILGKRCDYLWGWWLVVYHAKSWTNCIATGVSQCHSWTTYSKFHVMLSKEMILNLHIISSSLRRPDHPYHAPSKLKEEGRLISTKPKISW